MDINLIGLGLHGNIFPSPIDMERCSKIVRDTISVIVRTINIQDFQYNVNIFV